MEKKMNVPTSPASVDISAARPGSIAAFRCGGSAVIEEVHQSTTEYAYIKFKGANFSPCWYLSGSFSKGQITPVDIVSITPAPIEASALIAPAVDLSTAHAGNVVTFRCGGSAVVEKIEIVIQSYWLGFKGFNHTNAYSKHGGCFFHSPNPFDIVAIVNRRTDEERLAEITQIVEAANDTLSSDTLVRIHAITTEGESK